MKGIDGAFLLTPFQCDTCWFRNLKLRDPSSSSHSDKRLLAFIRRVNLDLIWSRSPSTISSVRRNISNLLKSWKELNIHPNLPPLGPWPLKDSVGFSLALGELRFSMNKGKNVTQHLQFDTIRKLRTSVSHVYESSHDAASQNIVAFRSMKGDLFTSSACPTQSRFFTMFTRGLLLRMGKQTKVNKGLDYRVILKAQDILEAKIQERDTTSDDRRTAVLLGAFLIFGFVLSLRGNEIFMIESSELVAHIHHGKSPSDNVASHVVIPLLGRFKNEDGERLHLMLSSSITSSGIKVRFWAEELTKVIVREGNKPGPAFRTSEGQPWFISMVNELLFDLLEEIQVSFSELLPSEVDIRESFSVYRSLRKGSTARAVDQKVPTTSIDLHNRWRSIENRRGQRSSSSMRDYYTDLRLTIKTRLQYTQAL